MLKEKLLWKILISAIFLYGTGMAITQISGNMLIFVFLTYSSLAVALSLVIILFYKNSIDKKDSFEEVMKLLIKEELENHVKR